MIILDFETNSQNIGDVIEVAAVKLEKNGNEYKLLDKFHRYYLSRYPVNYYSYAVHRLTPELILEYREDKEYSSYFTEDLDFRVAGLTTWVGQDSTGEFISFFARGNALTINERQNANGEWLLKGTTIANFVPALNLNVFAKFNSANDVYVSVGNQGAYLGRYNGSEWNFSRIPNINSVQQIVLYSWW